MVIGRFQKASGLSDALLWQIIKSKPDLSPIPIVANANFGHTTPQFTFPIGGKGVLAAEANKVSFTIIEH
jgi:muramoyltetrapeptide carboxypeptidase LdcA involved in peptidoglycan recycling